MSARIEDIGYARYEGERRSRLAAIWSLARFGALGTLGARRSWRAKIIPIALIALAFAPTIVVLGIHALVSSRFEGRFPDLVPYSSYYLEIGIVVLLFAGITTPDLLCPDRRHRVLSLYLSTAVSRPEYVAGRMLGALLPLLLCTLAPVLVLYGGNTVFADDSYTYLQGPLVGATAHPRRRLPAGGLLRADRPCDLLADEQARARHRHLRRRHAREPDARRHPGVRARCRRRLAARRRCLASPSCACGASTRTGTRTPAMPRSGHGGR